MPVRIISYIITGASRGLGRAIAVTSASFHLQQQQLSPTEELLQLHYILVARSEQVLEELKLQLETMATHKIHICVSCHAVDLGNLDTLDASWDAILLNVVIVVDILCSTTQKIYFVNNAGSLGHLGQCTASPSLQDMRQTVDLNVTSCLWSSIRVAQYIKECQKDLQPKQQIKSAVLINISSLVAISDDFLTMGIYSAGKGARNKYHTILAKEEARTVATACTSTAPSTATATPIKTLNYAPGPLETEMTQQLRASSNLDVELQKNFEKQLLDANDSAMKLIRLLDQNDFESGTHIDYYDLPENPPLRPRGCDTFVAFPPATPPGNVIFGKNSDRPTGEGQSIKRYPRQSHLRGTKLKCTYIEIDQVETTHAVLLSQIDWMFGAEMGANERDVVIGNEAIWTRDDASSEPNFLLGMDLVRLGLERGDTALHALEVITDLLERYGQGGACAEDDPSFCYHNSYLIVDQSEAWVLETSGRHWVAKRIKKCVYNISNCMSIRSDFDRCSDGIRDYATKQGYWNETEGPFDFAEAFSSCGGADAEMSDPRFCGGRRLLEKHSGRGTLNKEAMMDILRDHTSGICMHGGGFETTSAWITVFSVRDSEKMQHFVTGGPHPCKAAFKEESVL